MFDYDWALFIWGFEVVLPMGLCVLVARAVSFCVLVLPSVS